MASELLLAPVVEVFTSSVPPPPPPRTCSLSSGRLRAGLRLTRAAECPPLLSHYQPVCLCPAHLSLCAGWFTPAVETCDHSAGYQELQAASVLRWRRVRRQTIWHNQTIRTFCFDQRTEKTAARQHKWVSNWTLHPKHECSQSWHYAIMAGCEETLLRTQVALKSIFSMCQIN